MRTSRLTLRAALLSSLAIAWVIPGTVLASPQRCAGELVGRIVGVLAPPGTLQIPSSVIRAGSSVPVENGMPLCAGDYVSSGSATLRLALSAAEPGNPESEITLSPHASIELNNPRSIFVRIGRVFAELRGFFEANTVFARLGARGTQLQIDVSELGIEVIQLEGELEFQPLNPEGPPRSAHLLSPAGEPTSSSFLPQAKQKRPAGRPSSPPPALTLGRLSRAVYVPANNASPQVLGTGDELVRTVVDTDALVVLRTRPALPSRNSIRLFRSDKELAESYRQARFQTIWSPKESDSFRMLAEVYVDWAQGEKALQAFKIAGEPLDAKPRLDPGLYAMGERLMGVGGRAVYYNNLGNAYRLAGWPEEAMRYYNMALKEDSQFAFPYNGLGDVFQDLALAEFDRGNFTRAGQLLDKAEGLYKESLSPSLWGKEGGHNSAVPKFHLGEIFLLRAGITKDTERAEMDLLEAARHFQEARNNAPQSPFVQIGLSRIEVQRARWLQKSENAGAAKERLRQARSLCQSVLRSYPDFAPAHLALGETYEQEEDWKSAAASFARATQADPQYAPAYYKTGIALQRAGDFALARNYYAAYLQVESPLYRDGLRVREAQRAMSEKSIRPPGSEKIETPRLLGLPLEEARDILEHSGLRPGRVRSMQSDAPKDSIVRQQPDPGTEVVPDTKVDLWRSSGPRREETVPSVIGLRPLEATFVLAFRGLRMRQEKVDERGEPGRIVRQVPEAGATAQQDTEVVVYVPSGTSSPPSVQPPTTPAGSQIQVRCTTSPQSIPAGGLVEIRVLAFTEKGSPVGSANVRIESGGGLFSRSRTTIELGETDPGGAFMTQWRSPDPAARGYGMNVTVTKDGLTVGRGECNVSIQSGAGPVMVPDVVRLTVIQAKARIEEVGLRFRRLIIDAEGDSNVVVRQEPAAGTQVQRGTEVRVYTYAGIR